MKSSRGRQYAVASVLLATAAGLPVGAATASRTRHSETVSTPPKAMAALIANAKKEGTLTFAAPFPISEAGPFVKPFEQRYGIQVQIISAPSPLVTQQFASENETGHEQIDVIDTSEWRQTKYFSTHGLLAHYVPEASSNYSGAEVIKGYAYPASITSGGIAWNTKTTPPRVQRLLEKNPFLALLNPALKGKVLLPDPAAGGSGLSYYAYLIYGPGAKQYGWSYLTKLAGQQPAFSGSVAAILSDIEAGTYNVTMFGDSSIFGPAAANGAPVRFASEANMNGSTFVEAIAKHAPHPYAARLFEEWLLGKSGQAAMSSAIGQASAMQGWVDNRTWVTQLSWFTPPQKLYFGWLYDYRLFGDNFTAFLKRFDALYHLSS